MSNIGRIKSDLRTDPGLVRGHNEDFVDFREPETSEQEAQHGWLYLVADGVGGADAGEVASQYASEQTIIHYLSNTEESDWGQRILDAMQAANDDLRRLVVQKNNNSRMATTMVAAIIQDGHLYISNVGDSRGYHWRQGAFKQITKDQSLVAKLVEEGAITEEEARNHPRKNVILYSLGSENVPKIDLFELTWEAGDILVLCSDGLTKHVEDAEISQIVAAEPPEQATNTLIALANERGGEDNISVAVVRFEADTQKKRLMGSKTAVSAGTPDQYRAMLWFYTLFLSFVEAALIGLLWFFLRV